MFIVKRDDTHNLRQMYEDFGRQVIAPRAERFYTLGEFDRRSWRELAESGFWRIGVPREDGGSGGSWQDFATALEGLARSCGDLGFLLSLIAHAGFLRGVVEFGTQEQRHRFLPRLMGGSVGSTAITEPTGGSDVAALRTSARTTSSGYRLRGEKTHITNAPVADILLVVGRIPELGKRDITIFLVDAHAPGVMRGEAEVLFGNRTSPTGPLIFDEVELGADAVLGLPGEGLQTLYNVISFDRVLYGLIAAAYLEPLLEQGLRFAQQRQAFKTSIAEHEYIQGRLTDIKLTIESVRSVSRTALDALVAGDREASLLCSTAKLLGSEGLVASTRHLMCILGHRAYMEGPVSRAIRDALGTLIAGGTTEMQRKNIFNQMVQLYQGKEAADGTA